MEHNKEAIQIMKDFVEGRMDIATFKEQFDNNPQIKRTLEIDPKRVKTERYGYNLVPYLETININKTNGAYSMFYNVMSFLDRNDYKYIPVKAYENKYMFLLQIQPDWLDIDEDFLNKEVIEKIPEGLTEAQKKKWCKNRIKELFRYDTKPPVWVQNPEWPIKNGKPLVFRKRTKDKLDDERVYFYFYDPDTGETEIVMQFY